METYFKQFYNFYNYKKIHLQYFKWLKCIEF